MMEVNKDDNQEVGTGSGTGEELTRLPLYIPIVRFDEANWTVTGQATVEDLDAYGTVFDYEASKRAFSQWRGNIREMHQDKAVGRALEVTYDDGAKRILVTSKISRGAKDTWEKVKDGTLTGYSVGALAGKSDWGTVDRNGKSVPLLKNYRMAELSLVDNPATPGCDISIVRADGMANPDVLMEETEVEAMDAATDTRNAQATDTRAGAKVSHVMQGSLHRMRDNALQQAIEVMKTCECEACATAMAAIDPDNDGDIDCLGGVGDVDGDAGTSDMMAGYRTLEPVITRALAPHIQRVNAALAHFIQNTNHAPLAPASVDLTTIERRLADIEQNAKAVTEVETLTRALDAKIGELRELTERIANQPVGGGPIQNAAAMEKMLATQGSSRNSTGSDMDAIVRAAQLGAFQSSEDQVKAAAKYIQLQRGL